MMAVAIAALAIGSAVGFVMARRFMLRLLAALFCALIALFLMVLNADVTVLPGNGYALTLATLLMAPPMAAGLAGGAIMAWLARPRPKAT